MSTQPAKTNDVSKLVLDAQGIERSLVRICHEIIERNKGIENIAIVGIRTRGAALAARIAEQIGRIENTEIPLGVLDITLYRDDLSEISAQPLMRGTELDFDINEKVIILVDDVLFTGRTIRCALDALVDYGRAACIQLAILIDRGHRELPVKADYVGKNIPTSRNEDVRVHLKETDDKDEVFVRVRPV